MSFMMAIALLSSCATNTTGYVTETAGDTSFSLEAIKTGVFRLGKAKGNDTSISFLKEAKKK